MTPTGPCSLPPEALEERLDAWHALSGALLADQRTARGAVLRYRLHPDVVETLLELIEAERRCCPSLSFEAGVTVLVEVPEVMRPWVTSVFLGGSGKAQATTAEE